MRGMLRITAVGASSVALILFVMSGAGCSNQEAGSAKSAAKTMSGEHDHSAHEHGSAGHDHSAHDQGAHATQSGNDHAGHDHSAHDHGAAGHKPAAGTGEPVAKKLCPVMDEEIDPEVFTMHNGRKVYFCCDDCIAMFKKDPAKYLAKLDSGT